MSFSSKARKVKPTGIVHELKLVPTVNRHGTLIIKTEEVKTPNREKEASSSYRINSSSPTKKSKTVAFNGEPIPCHLEVDESSKKRHTLVFPILLINKISLTFFRAKTTIWNSSWATRKPT